MFTAPSTARSYINGGWVNDPAVTGVPVRNPAQPEEMVGQAYWASEANAQDAMQAAYYAWPAWKAQPLPARLALLRAALDALNTNIQAMARLITLENGKTLAESQSEVNATLRDGYAQLDLLLNTPLQDTVTPSQTFIRREPLGVVLLITPWNFPLATIGRKLIPALALGNTLVLKPSELTPLTATTFFEFLIQSGLPHGAANLLIGDGPSLGPTLTRHPALRGLSFTGSTRVGKWLCEQVAARDVKVQMEMGGKNALVVLADANLEAAVEAAAVGAFSCAGQWCTGTSRVVVQESVYIPFIDRLRQRVADLRVGDGFEAGVQMGPVISQAQHTRINAAIENGLASGAQRLTGGGSIEGGYFIEPTIFINVTPEMALAQEEIFGPVLSVLKAKDEEDALQIANSTPYGLSFSVYTRSPIWAERFMNDAQAGLCHVNLPTHYREANMPILGWRDSGRGAPECGLSAVEAFTRSKAIYQRL
jgi:alpha-ketoglutaric semialdehyde dehydrogenase